MLKQLILFFLLLFLGSIDNKISAQKQLLGSYCPDIKTIAFQSEYFKFFEDNRFLYILSDDTGTHYGKGKYVITKDSLFLHYTNLPEMLTTPQCIVDSTMDSLSHLQFINTLDKNINYEISCAIYEGDSLISSKKSKTSGYITFLLKANQNAILTAMLIDYKDVFTPFIRFKIEGKNYGQNIIYTHPGLHLYGGHKGKQSISFPVKFTSTGFKLKDYSGWNKFKAC